MGPYVPYVAVAVTAVAALIAYWKYASDRAAQQLANAMQIYRKYLELAFEYPHLAEPKIYKDQIVDIERSRYEWFISILLRACEEILEHLDNQPDDTWRTTIIDQLALHSDYLESDKWFRETGIEHYSQAVRVLIARAIEKSKS